MTMTSMQRLLTALGHQEPDRVPYLLLDSLRPARALGMSLKDYFSRAEHVVEGQLWSREKFGQDALDALFYAPIEIEAWGGEVIFRDDCPPNSGRPFITDPHQIKTLQAPRVGDSPRLCEVLKAISLMKQAVGGDVPIFGVAVSPFSLPVMQLGFDHYLDLIYEHRPLFRRLMEKNTQFCIEWSNAQLEAGATGIVYFDPVGSPTIVPRSVYLELAQPLAATVLKALKGPVAMHFASGKCLSILNDVASTGAVGVGVSAQEDLATLKAAARGRIALIGNLNGVEMRRWTPAEAEQQVKSAIAKAGPGGGFILSDNHGEIPFQVQDEVLSAIAEAVDRWGRYPLDWVTQDHG